MESYPASVRAQYYITLEYLIILYFTYLVTSLLYLLTYLLSLLTLTYFAYLFNFVPWVWAETPAKYDFNVYLGYLLILYTLLN